MPSEEDLLPLVAVGVVSVAPGADRGDAVGVVEVAGHHAGVEPTTPWRRLPTPLVLSVQLDLATLPVEHRLQRRRDLGINESTLGTELARITYTGHRADPDGNPVRPAGHHVDPGRTP